MPILNSTFPKLQERLRSGAYGDQPLNVEEPLWRRVLMPQKPVKKASRNTPKRQIVYGMEKELVPREMLIV